MNRRILLVVDYRGVFWGSSRHPAGLWSMDVRALRAALGSRGFEPEVREFADIDLSRSDLTGIPVLYTSSEDNGAHYKRFIESRILGLTLIGARPIPGFPFLLAHHDKAMMEALRHALLREMPGQPTARAFGTLEEFTSRTDTLPSNPAVLKPSHGAGSRGVALYSGRRSDRRRLRRLMHSAGLDETLRELAKRLVRRGHILRSLHRRPIVLQEFQPGMRGDYKVLRFGERLYVMHRACPPGDFRASGAHLWDHEPGKNTNLSPMLDAAWEWSEALGTPFCSLDIGYDPASGISPFLIEFQAVNFGPSAAEKSPGYYALHDGTWKLVADQCVLEEVFAEAVLQHLRTRGD